MTSPWNQLENESSRAFFVFSAYRDQGLKRSCNSLAKQLKMNRSAVMELSKRYNWQERVKAWDANLDQITQNDQVEAIRAMKKRQISLALKAQRFAEKALEKLIEHIEAKDADLFRPQDLSKLLDSGCRLERLNRDLPEQNLELMQQQNFEKLSLEEQENLRNLLLKTGNN